MAPDLALEKIESLTLPGDVVLDPMCGSGTVPRLAVEVGRRAVACDLDPLAVLMTRTACKPAWSEHLTRRAEVVVRSAMALDDALPPWIAQDTPSREFVHYWFAPAQRAALSRLSRVLMERPGKDDPLRVALSRLIVTKEGGASLARDTSHSRPHRVRLVNDFDVYAEFIKAAGRVEMRVGGDESSHRPSVRAADARALGFLPPHSVDLVVTSPPYLNAIDYLRGHRLSLVWLEKTITDLRQIRREVIGVERAPSQSRLSIGPIAREAVPRLDDLAPRMQRIVCRFAGDIDRLCRSLARVTRPGGHLVFVVADSQVRGIPVSNSALCGLAAQRYGFTLKEKVLRSLPAQHRYLPPPETHEGALGGRMREEVVLTFERQANRACRS